ncbi:MULTISPECIES: pentapeptide repeat-containing protein [unclassified Kribbella]|uniref:pentapeptide repeat-containing protein n=1 Tax=unclassified Kribbella TaxID=2644121 RepID=UPI003017630C
MSDGQDVAFTRGLIIDRALLDELIAHAASIGTERPALVRADFSGATFVNVSSFDGITFAGGAAFEGTLFEQPLFMSNCSFEDDAYFSRARFRSNATFHGVHFTHGTFERVLFELGADFSECEFESLSLYGTRSRETLALPGVVVHGEAAIGPVFSTKSIRLDGSQFEGVATIDVVARELTCMATTFNRATLMRVRRALVVLDHAVFRQPSTLAATIGVFERALADYDEGDLFDEAPLERLGLPQQPSLISLNLVDAGFLSLSGVNLSACLFRGARNLDGLRIEGSRTFGRTPRGVRWVRAWPPVRWWTRRRVVADEVVWRAAFEPVDEKRATRASDEARWQAPALLKLLSHRSFDFVSNTVAPDPASIAEIYRSLRKADEKAGNEPAAADFYYGEMEMRRAAECPRSERVLLFLYWLVAGYGLRASRALTALLVTVLVFALGLYAWGFTEPTTLTTSVLYSAYSTVSLLRAPERDLTTAGQFMDIALRLLGPLFFGLILLALRGRVKR